MMWLLSNWKVIVSFLGSAVLAVTASLWIMIPRVKLAQSERDVARVELTGTRIAFEAEKVSTSAAVDAANRCQADTAERESRFTTAIGEAQLASQRCRVQLAKCVTPEAVIERAGGMFQ
jgi:hypothetical protein